MSKRANGEGCVIKDPNKPGRWMGIITLPNSPDGKRRRKSVYGYSAAEVRDRMEAERAKRDDTQVNFTRQTTGEYLTHWLEFNARTTIRPATHVCYATTLKNHILPNISSILLKDVTGQHVQNVLSAMEKAEASPRMRQLALAIMRVAFKAAGPRPMGLGLLAFNPCSGVKSPRVEHKAMKFWEIEQVKTFLRFIAQDRSFALYVLAVLTGMRQGEILGLKWTDLSVKDGHMILSIERTLSEVGGQVFGTSNPKSKAGTRLLVLPAVVRKALEQHAEEMFLEGQTSEFVFLTKEGEHFTKSNLIKHFQKLSKKAGVPVMRFHDLRHTAVSIMGKSVADMAFLKTQIGHSDIKLTIGTYMHLFQEKKTEMAGQVDDMFPNTNAPEAT